MFKIIRTNFSNSKGKDVPEGYYAVDIDPSYNLGYHELLVCQRESITFDEMICCLQKCFLKADYLGCYSLIYWKYYKEFYNWIVFSLQEKEILNKIIIIRFYNKALLRWIKFIEYSDDTFYPQNEYFRLMQNEILSKIHN